MVYRDPEQDRARARIAWRTAERIALGLCPRCGKLPPAPERSVCKPCGECRNRTGRARDAKLRAEDRPRRDPEKARASGPKRTRRQTAERLAIRNKALYTEGICSR